MREGQKRAALSREQLGIVDSDKDVYETAETPDNDEVSDEVQQLQRELHANRRSSKEDRPAQPAPIDRASIEPPRPGTSLRRGMWCACQRKPTSRTRHAPRYRRLCSRLIVESN